VWSFRLARCRVRRKLWLQLWYLIFIVVFLTEFTSPYSLNTQRRWHTSESDVYLLSIIFCEEKEISPFLEILCPFDYFVGGGVCRVQKVIQNPEPVFFSWSEWPSFTPIHTLVTTVEVLELDNKIVWHLALCVIRKFAINRNTVTAVYRSAYFIFQFIAAALPRRSATYHDHNWHIGSLIWGSDCHCI